MPLTTTASNALSLTQVGSLTLPGAEISAFDAATKTLWVTSLTGLRVLDFSNPASPTVIQTITFTGTPGSSNDVNSVAIKNGIVAVAVNGSPATDNGKVFLFNAAGTLLNTINVGAVPDNLVFTPDGTKILVANEGESNLTSVATQLTSNPVGSISIIDVSGGAASATVQTAGFDAYNSQAASLIASGVRLFTSVPAFSAVGTTVAQDLEPEYIAISPDGTKAMVTLQEANSIAVVDIATATVTSIIPLGLKDFSTGLFDGSDRDGAGNTTLINLVANRPVFGLYQPDAIASFSVGGQTYYITANEGDDRNDFLSGSGETTTVGNAGYVLDPTAFGGATNIAALKANTGIGRLTVSNLTGLRGDTDGDGDIDQIISYGGRSFSILDSNGTRIFDSGSHIDQFVAAFSPLNFDDTRSDNKGSEPEGVTTAVIGGKVYAFVGLERFAGTMVYDVTNPTDPSFVTFASSPAAFTAGSTTGAGFGTGNTAFQRPEGGIFISATDSPTGKALYVVSNEGTGTVGPNVASIVTYEVAQTGNSAPVITSDLGGTTASINVAENTTAVTTVTATDIDAGTTLAYSIAGGADAAKFAINASTGALSFVAAPNFEAPTDAGTNNVYDVIVRASDGTLSDDQAIAVTVTDVNDNAPVITSNLGGDTASVSIAENGTAVTTVTSTDADAGSTGVYSIAGGADAAKFAIDASTGVLTFIAAPNFEAPTDAGTNNVYDVIVRASDGTLFDEQAIAVTVTNVDEAYRLQILHYSDAEAGTLAPTTALNLAALVDRFEDVYANSVTVASGDLFLPGPFLAAGTDLSLKTVLNSISGSTISSLPTVQIPIGAFDIAIHNAIGVELSAIGNHEFDLSSRAFRDAISPNLGAAGWVGANFPYLSANLLFANNQIPGFTTGDADLGPRFTQTVGVGGLEAASSLKGRIAPSAVLTEGGERIGFVGATTQVLESISSPSGTEVAGFPYGPGPNGEVNDMDLLAAQLQPVIDDLIAQGVNKIVLVSHLQQIAFEQLLATKLRGVDVIIAGGSNTRLGDATDTAVAFPGHSADFDGTYPIVTAGADGKTTLIVNTDSEFTYLGRLLVDFNEAGEVIVPNIAANAAVSGAYAATTANVAAAWNDLDGDLSNSAFAAGTRGSNVKALTDAVNGVIQAKDGNIYGYSNVYLEGERATVRSQETNLGNVSADANADVARDALGLTNEHAIVSIKNGGGIRAQIGTIITNPDGSVTKVRPEANGEVSQLDVENALRFDNRLMVFDTTAQGLLNILNSPNSLNPNNGGFIQIGGVRFSYNPGNAVGSRVQDVVLVNEDGDITAVIADNGVVVAGAPSVITAIALNFTANGGDGYLIKANATNFRYLLNNGTVSAAVNPALDFTAAANVPANAIGEQQAFAEYFQERYATPATAYNQADTGQAFDTRIQNQAARTDTVLTGDYLLADATTSFAENGTGTAFQGVSTGLAGTISYSLIGTDASKFAVSSTGAVTFVASPDFENPTDAGTNNVYDVRVVASNGTNTTEQDVAITITDMNEAPVITSNGGGATAAISVVENASAVTTVSATDADAGTSLVYSIAGGDDAGKFAINAATGALLFIAAPNFEAPTDAGTNNVYDVVVRASDGTLFDDQAIAVSVTDGPDTFTGTAFRDTLTGTSGADLIFGLASNDTLNGLGGNDTLDGGTGNDTMNGGLGDDTYIVDTFLDKSVELADQGTDTVLTSIASYRLGDNVENLTFTYTEGSGGRALGNAIANVLTGAAAADTLLGYGGNDMLYGLGGIDTLNGGEGNDFLDGGTGPDTLVGGLGDDVFIVDDLGDIVREGADAGTDRVESSVSFIALANVENLTLTGTAAINGTTGRLANILTGNGGDNVLFGAGGADTLLGMGGSDTLNGGTGQDRLTGGLGGDTFLFASNSSASLGSTADVVTDFSRSEGDKLAFSKTIFTGLGAIGGLDAAAFQSGTVALDATDRIIYNQTTGELFYDADGNGRRAQVLVATIGDTVHSALAFDDFLIMA